ncbi:MAG: hypothetical protein QM808_01695 [Steroidobacteraceae bacterium]
MLNKSVISPALTGLLCFSLAVLSQAAVAAQSPQGDTRASILKLPDWSGTWIGSSTMFNIPGKVPPMLTPMGAARLEEYKKEAAAGRYLVAQERCSPRGMPLVMSGAYAAYEFLFTPGQVTIIPETNEVRRIYTDGRKQLEDPDPTFNGHSVGHWEGNVLVVDTLGVLPESELLAYLPETGKTHITERIYRKSADVMQIDTVIEDADLLAKPWSYSRSYKRSPSEMTEFICTQSSESNSSEYDLTPPK